MLKPVISGYEECSIDSSDSGILLKSMGLEISHGNVCQISPWRFKAALSPDMAASREGRSINFAQLVEFCRTSISTNTSKDIVTLIEGVGGTMVPLDAEHTVLDWISSLKIPTILVAGTYLGTISHTLTAYKALASKGINVSNIILSQSEKSPVPMSETRATISRFLPGIDITGIGRINKTFATWKHCPDLLQILT